MNPILGFAGIFDVGLSGRRSGDSQPEMASFGRHGEYFRVKCQFGSPVLVARAKHRRGTQQSYYYSVVHVLCQLILLFKRFKHFLARFSEKADPKVIAIHSKDDSVNYLTGLVRILLSEHCQQCVIIDSVTHRLKPD